MKTCFMALVAPVPVILHLQQMGPGASKHVVKIVGFARKLMDWTGVWRLLYQTAVPVVGMEWNGMGWDTRDIGRISVCNH